MRSKPAEGSSELAECRIHEGTNSIEGPISQGTMEQSSMPELSDTNAYVMPPHAKLLKASTCHAMHRDKFSVAVGVHGLHNFELESTAERGIADCSEIRIFVHYNSDRGLGPASSRKVLQSPATSIATNHEQLLSPLLLQLYSHERRQK